MEKFPLSPCSILSPGLQLVWFCVLKHGRRQAFVCNVKERLCAAVRGPSQGRLVCLHRSPVVPNQPRPNLQRVKLHQGSVRYTALLEMSSTFRNRKHLTIFGVEGEGSSTDTGSYRLHGTTTQKVQGMSRPPCCAGLQIMPERGASAS